MDLPQPPVGGSADRDPVSPAALDAKARLDLGWPPLIEHLAARTHTTRGAEAARALQPSLDAGWVHGRLAEVSEGRALWDRGEPMPFGAVYDLGLHLDRAEKGGHLDGPALREVGSTLTAGGRLRRHLAARGGAGEGLTPRLAGRAALISELADVAGPIAEAFDDLGQLLDTASPALGPLRRKAAALRDELDRKSHSLLDHPDIAPHLQDRFYTRREDRFVLPIRVDARTRVRGIVHGISGSGHTVFVEPEAIVDLNNRLKLAELEVSEEERRILGQLTLLVTDAVRPIRVNLEVLAELDLVDAAARLSIDLRASEPLLVEEQAGAGAPPLIDLRRARHPLMVLAGRECVPNDIVVRRGGTLIVSGPNAGGKTVALKTAGLLMLMARAGLHVPAQEGSSLPLLGRVLTDVGDDQSLERDLSTFSGHILHLNAFLATAGPDTLILLDEIAVGTDPEQGAALAEAVLEGLAARSATIIVTTHYERLKSLASRDPRFANASVGFDMDELRPTYELHLGVPGASGALVVARRLGLPPAIAARAESLLGTGSQEIERLLNQLAEERQRMRRATEAADGERIAAEQERERLSELAAEAEARVKAARRAEHDEAVESLRRARVELDRLRGELKKGTGSAGSAGAAMSRQQADEAERAIDEAARALKQHAPPGEPLPGRPARPGELSAGAVVLVARLGGRGVVVAPPRAGKVVVQAGALRLTLDEGELLIPDASGPPAPPHGPSARALREERSDGRASWRAAPPADDDGAPAASVRMSGNTIDLRGERVDSAIGLLEKFLDEATRDGVDTVFVIHGHGTGALRSALREHLGAFPVVASLRPGSQTEGGDGVTVVTLR